MRICQVQSKPRLTELTLVHAEKEKYIIEQMFYVLTTRVHGEYKQIRRKRTDDHWNQDDEGVWIHQNAWFHLGKFDKGVNADYQFKQNGNGLYIFVLNGDINVDGQELNKRDGYGIWETDKVNIKADSDAEFLLMEVPMNI